MPWRQSDADFFNRIGHNRTHCCLLSRHKRPTLQPQRPGRDRRVRHPGVPTPARNFVLLDAWREAALTSRGDGTEDTLYGWLPEETSLHGLERVYARISPDPAPQRLVGPCVAV